MSPLHQTKCSCVLMAGWSLEYEVTEDRILRTLWQENKFSDGIIVFYLVFCKIDSAKCKVMYNDHFMVFMLGGHAFCNNCNKCIVKISC